MSERGDGRWEPPTQTDGPPDRGELGEDPPTRPATLAEAVRARAMSRQPSVLATTLPPPATARPPARPSQPEVSDVVLLDTVARGAEASSAPERTETAAGGLVVVATGADAERMRRLAHGAALHVPIVASLGVVHEAASIVVLGEPSSPVPDRVVYVARPTLSEDMLLALLRALVSSRVVAETPVRPVGESLASEHAARIGAAGDRAAIEQLGCDAILSLAGCDRAQLLFHDPATGAAWSETRLHAGGDDRRAAMGLVGWCAHTGHAVMASPAGDDPRYVLELDDPEGKPQSRVLVQPVIGADRRVHALLVAARRWRRTDFTELERGLLRDLAARIAPAIELVAAAPRRRSTRPTTPGLAATTPAGANSSADAELSPATTMPLPQQGREPVSPATTMPLPQQAREPVAPASLRLPSQPPASASASTSGAAKRLPSQPPVSSSSSSSGARARRPSRDGAEPRDIAVVATQPGDIARVQKLASKARLEVSVLSSADEVPPYYRIVTIGEAWTPDSDARVAYAARSELTDEQLVDLLTGLALDRAAGSLAVQKPQTIAEARRLQPALASLASLASADLAQAEQVAIEVVRQGLDADRAYCLFFDGEDGSLWSERRERKHGDDRRAIAGVTGWAARTGRAASVARASADPRWLGPLDDPDGDPNSQLLVQPMLAADRRVIGVLVAVRRPKRPGFGEPDAAYLGQLAALLGPLLEQIELGADVQQLLRDASASHDAVALTSPLDRLRARVAGLPRWSYALGGAALATAVMALARC